MMHLVHQANARELLNQLRTTQKTKSKMIMSNTMSCSIMAFIPSETFLGIDPEAVNLLWIINEMNGMDLYWRRHIRRQAEVWQDNRLLDIRNKRRSFAEIADLLETFWFTNASLKTL
jgi:hypothetical protein